jgi:hypothetical protein
MEVWYDILPLFKLTNFFSDIFFFFPYHLQHGFGTQLQLFWWRMIGAGFYSIWHVRNSIRFKESKPIIISLIRSIQLQIYEVDSWDHAQFG